jgi:hypothetical protein
VERLPSKCRALSSNSSTIKKKKKEKATRVPEQDVFPLPQSPHYGARVLMVTTPGSGCHLQQSQ